MKIMAFLFLRVLLLNANCAYDLQSIYALIIFCILGCDASSEVPNFQCPRHKLKTSPSQQNSQMPLALRSLPPEVGLCMSSIPGAGCGICAKRKIPVGAWIGPYEGKLVKPEELSSSMDTSYMWEVRSWNQCY